MKTLSLTSCCLLLAGCMATTPAPVIRYPAHYADTAAQAIVFVANGSGDSGVTVDRLRRASSRAGVPLRVVPVDWSYGKNQILADHLDRENQREQGRRLAAQVLELRRTDPQQQVYLLGHSSGCAVILAAAENLPPGSVADVILLAPSVCAYHDLRPTLLASRGGMDVFFSELDSMVLGVGVGLVGTTDPYCRTAAGRYGFHPASRDDVDLALHQNLRQYGWDRSVTWTGNTGGHYGCLHVPYLQAYVLPIFMRSR